MGKVNMYLKIYMKYMHYVILLYFKASNGTLI